MARSKSSNLISQAAFARKHGVSPATVSRWRAAGWLVMQRGCVDAAATEIKLGERQRDYRGGTARGPAADDAAPAGVIAQLEAAEPRPPALHPKVPANAVLNGIAATIGAIGRVLPTLALQHGISARKAFALDMAVGSALADAAEGIANHTLGWTKVAADPDWATSATEDLPDAFWAAAAARNGDVFDPDKWMEIDRSRL